MGTAAAALYAGIKDVFQFRDVRFEKRMKNTKYFVSFFVIMEGLLQPFSAACLVERKYLCINFFTKLFLKTYFEVF